MIEIIEQWLNFGAKVNAQWGNEVFVVISYTITCLFALDFTRKQLLDSVVKQKPRPSNVRLFFVSLGIGLPLEFVIAFGLKRAPFVDALTHACLAGALVSVVAAAWIWLLKLLGRNDAARMFMYEPERRSDETPSDDTLRRRQADKVV